MEYELSGILIPEETIHKRVEELGRQISCDYAGQDVVAVGILKGAVIFMSDLIRCIDKDVRLQIDFMAVSSYGASTKSSGVVKIVKDLDLDIKDKEVLVVEDIVDSGLTLSYIDKLLSSRGPRSVRLCALLDKPERRLTPVDIAFRGFTIPDEFVVGYGLDYAGRWRNLPAIYTLRPAH